MFEQFHVKYRVQAKRWVVFNSKAFSNFNDNLGNGVKPIMKWAELQMRFVSCSLLLDT